MKQIILWAIYFVICIHLILFLYNVVPSITVGIGLVLQALYLACVRTLYNQSKIQSTTCILTSGMYLQVTNSFQSFQTAFLTFCFAAGLCFHKILWCATVLGKDTLKILDDPNFCTNTTRSCTKELFLLICCVWMVPMLLIASLESGKDDTDVEKHSSHLMRKTPSGMC